MLQDVPARVAARRGRGWFGVGCARVFPCGMGLGVVLTLGVLASSVGAQTTSETTAATTQSPAGPGATPARLRALGPLNAGLVDAFQGVRALSRPGLDASMGFAAPTIVREVLARPGAPVSRGQVIVRGDDVEDVALLKLQQVRVEEPLQVDRTRAAMDLAEVEYRRLREVFDRGGSGQLELERARLSFEVARIDHLLARNQQTQETIQLERMQARVDRARVIAPFDGIVDSVSVDAGQVVSENEKIVRVVSIDPMVIDVNAPSDEEATLRAKAGDPAWVLLGAAGRGFLATGQVIEVAPTADPASRTRRVRVQLPNPAGEERMLPGQTVWVRLSAPSEERLALSGAQATTTNAERAEAQNR